jgi:Xaa-Pro aminopeptidase
MLWVCKRARSAVESETMRKLLLFLALCSLPWLTLPSAAMERQPNGDYRARREALARKIGNGVAVVFAGTEVEASATGFRQTDNFYYLTGWSEPGAAVLVASAREASPGRPYTEILLLPSRDLVEERWTGVKLGPDSPEAAAKTGFDRVLALGALDEELPRLLTKEDKVYVELTGSEALPTPTSTGLMEWLKRSRAIPGRIPTVDVRPIMASLRTVKDAGELTLMKKAAEASMAAHLAVMKALKPGMNEREVAAILNYEAEKRGCERPSYAPIVGSGFNGTVLHYSEDDGAINAGDLVVIDAAGEYSMYADDITRTLPASGKFTPRQREIYDIVLGAQQAAIAAFQSGKSTLGRKTENSLDLVARDYIKTHGKDLHGASLDQYFIHGLGHYVGLFVHDDNDYTVPLGPGAVFTIEPGIYIPEEKFGVRIEDMFYVDADGKLVKMTAALPSAADEVEKAMKGK